MQNPTSNQWSLGPLLIETTLIVLGVALAFAANEWRVQYNNQARADFALQSIREEIVQNKESVEQSLHYHKYLIDSLVAISRQPAPKPIPGIRLFHKGFISSASIVSTAWETAAVTDALRYIDYRQVLLISKLYKQQENYQDQTKGVGQLIYAQIFEGGKDAILAKYKHLAEVISTFYWREKSLLDAYEQTLPQLKETP